MKLKKKDYPYMYVVCIVLIISFSAINCYSDQNKKNNSTKTGKTNKNKDVISNILF